MKINPRIVGVVLLVGLILVLLILTLRGRHGDVAAPRSDVSGSSPASTAATPEVDALPEAFLLRQQLGRFTVAYASPSGKERSQALRDLCLDEKTYLSLGSEGDDTSTAAAGANDTVIMLTHLGKSEVAPVWNQQESRATVVSTFEIDVITNEVLEYSVPATYQTVWKYQDGEWLLVALVA